MIIPNNLIEEIPFTGTSTTRRAYKFIKGPIPLWYLGIVSRECRPTALPLALLMFHRLGMGVTPRPITANEMDLLGTTRWGKTEALRDLEAAHLITIQLRGKRLVPILDLTTRKPTQ
jgi:hypothetical protein